MIEFMTVDSVTAWIAIEVETKFFCIARNSNFPLAGPPPQFERNAIVLLCNLKQRTSVLFA